ncbi:MAG: hypothetical protein KGH63_01535 [Candidatus Micrarchaeota archaeon]|nr:hypothetical protein [Candidatus Micrarchaeota archaeon]
MASRAVWLALAVVLVLSLSFLAFHPSLAPGAAPSSGVSLFTLSDARLADWGGQPAVYGALSGNASAAGAPLHVQFDALDAPPPRRVVLLTGPWSGASHLSSWLPALSPLLRPAGWTLESRSLSNLTREREGRFILLPSGAWPADLLARWNSSLGPDDTLVYFGVADNLTLGADGGAHAGGVPAPLLASGPSLDERLPNSAVLAGPAGVRVWRIPHTLDEFPDLSELSSALVSRMLEPSADHLLARSSTPYAGARWAAVLPLPAGFAMPSASSPLPPPGSSSPAWARLRLYDSQGRLLRLWDAPLSPPDGILVSPPEALPGQNLSIQIRLMPRLAQTEQVDYELHVYSPDGRLWGSDALGGAFIGPQNASGSNDSLPAQAWVGSQVLREWPGPGLVRLEVADQYGRTYAQAVVDAPDYRVTALDGNGYTRRFLLTRDGVPLGLSQVAVRADNSSLSRALPLSEGIVSISADWPAGAHVLHFTADGASLDYSWNEEPGGAWAALWQIGLPGLVLAALIFAVVRPRARPSYTLVIPEWPARAPQRLELTAEQMRLLVSRAGARVGGRSGEKAKSSSARAGPNPRPISSARPVPGAPAAIQAADLVSVLQHPPGGGKPALVSLESAERALQGLERAGQLVRWRDYYALPSHARSSRPSASAAPSDGVRALALARLLRDQLLTGGVALSPAPSPAGLWEDSRRQRWMVWHRQGISELARLRPDRLLFADAGEREEFLRTLSGDGSPAASRLQLMRQLGRLRLCLAGQPLDE